VYQDGGSNFTVTLQTSRSNFGSPFSKIEDEVTVVGDATTGNLTVATSDDDYATWSSTRTIDMSKPLKKLTRLGSFYSRAHRFAYADNYAFRVQAYLPGIRIGIG